MSTNPAPIGRFLLIARNDLCGENPRAEEDRLMPGLTACRAIELAAEAALYGGHTEGSKRAITEMNNWLHGRGVA